MPDDDRPGSKDGGVTPNPLLPALHTWPTWPRISAIANSQIAILEDVQEFHRRVLELWLTALAASGGRPSSAGRISTMWPSISMIVGAQSAILEEAQEFHRRVLLDWLPALGDS